MKQTILVIGATGAQGGSVARHLIQQGKFNVRILTRNAKSDKALQFKYLGAEIAEGDLNNMASVSNAITGCYGVFGVTNFWEHFDGEFQHGKNLIDAVHKAGIEHFVFSTLPSAIGISGGKLSVPHLDIKAELEAYSKSLNIPATYIHVAFYYENFLSFFPPKRLEDNTWHFGFPQGDTPLAAVSIEDCGGIISEIFNNPQQFIGKRVGIVGDDVTCYEYAATMSEVLGKKIIYDYIPQQLYASFGFPGAEELANMFEFNRTYINGRNADLEESRNLYPQINSFKQWITANRNKFEALLTIEKETLIN
ncbi:MAG: NmrA/HSCARG family protein [Daejeonella sp.]|uniref:NmrA/HSCARG family protein n=1 Tax=Daejeonella sp. TaxID=2805397 RepID=UPI002732D419|nr:NmrA/HSCARG family protein [Daejeonella sp.]MDP3469557.1 NmrA/HSCARG family protein [Daejeonella sp.]